MKQNCNKSCYLYFKYFILSVQPSYNVDLGYPGVFLCHHLNKSVEMQRKYTLCCSENRFPSFGCRLIFSPWLYWCGNSNCRAADFYKI